MRGAGHERRLQPDCVRPVARRSAACCSSKAGRCTDRDWNDQALQLNRRIQAGTLDTIGTAVVPMETPEGFEILLTNGSMTIGSGRIYVHGLLAENHGQAPNGGTLVGIRNSRSCLALSR